MKCWINRGLPGSGKSTRAAYLQAELVLKGTWAVICSEDQYFVDPLSRIYTFDKSKHVEAHRWCQDTFRGLVHKRQPVIVDNTNLTRAECYPYVSFVVPRGYEVIFLEPDVPWAFDVEKLLDKNVHGVKRQTLEKMLASWEGGMTVEKVMSIKGQLGAHDESSSLQAYLQWAKFQEKGVQP
jgi:AAA domain